MKKIDIGYSYTNEDGKKVSGTAATAHEIYTVHGGLQNYHDHIGAAYINNFVNEHSDIINNSIIADSRRKQMKVVGK